MKVAIGADHAGVWLKGGIMPVIIGLGYDVVDVGCDCTTSVDYPDYAVPVAEMVASGEVDRGILICGTGIGMSITANKVPGVRCALVHDLFSAKASKEHNDTNVLAMGERVIGLGLAEEIVRVWLGTEFSQGERHIGRIRKVADVERKYHPEP